MSDSGMPVGKIGDVDFICVGMFDFQVRENAIIAKDAVARAQNRQRSWRA